MCYNIDIQERNKEIKNLTTYNFISRDYALAVMDGVLPVEFCLGLGLATKSERTYTWAECNAQIQTGRGFGERENWR